MFSFRSFVLVVAIVLAACDGCSSNNVPASLDLTSDATVDVVSSGDAAVSDAPVVVDVVEAATPVDAADAAAPAVDASLDARD